VLLSMRSGDRHRSMRDSWTAVCVCVWLCARAALRRIALQQARAAAGSSSASSLATLFVLPAFALVQIGAGFLLGSLIAGVRLVGDPERFEPERSVKPDGKVGWHPLQPSANAAGIAELTAEVSNTRMPRRHRLSF